MQAAWDVSQLETSPISALLHLPLPQCTHHLLPLQRSTSTARNFSVQPLSSKAGAFHGHVGVGFLAATTHPLLPHQRSLGIWGARGAGAAGGCLQRAGDDEDHGRKGISAHAKTGRQRRCVADPPGAASACFEVCPDVFCGVITMSPQERQRLETSQGFCLEKRA